MMVIEKCYLLLPVLITAVTSEELGCNLSGDISASLTGITCRLIEECLQKPCTREANLDIYCKGAEPFLIGNIWTSAKLELIPREGGDALYVAESAAAVVKLYRDHTSITSMWIEKLRLSTVGASTPWYNSSLPLYNTTCIGVESYSPYKAYYVRRRMNLYYPVMLVAGVTLLWLAPTLCRNVLLQYSTGVGLGIVASSLIVIFVLSRFIPKRSAAAGFLLTGWSLGLTLIGYVQQHFFDLLSQHYQLLLGYLICTTLLSFGVVYYKGPMENPRGIQLIQWLLQLCSLALIYNSTNHREASAACVLIAVLSYVLPIRSSHSLLSDLRTRWFPKPRRLLSEDEYIEQAHECTQKALSELRQFCRSPECDTWRFVKRVKDPVRFASFIEGDSHISDTEIIAYDSDQSIPYPMTDDESDS